MTKCVLYCFALSESTRARVIIPGLQNCGSHSPRSVVLCLRRYLFVFPVEAIVNNDPHTRMTQSNAFCRVDFTVFPPSTTNRSSWKNWLTTVCLYTVAVSFCVSVIDEERRKSERNHAHSGKSHLRKRNKFHPHTFIICSSFRPHCMKSCTFRSSTSVLCSWKESFVLRLAYSRKLYAANWLDCRSRDRNFGNNTD